MSHMLRHAFGHRSLTEKFRVHSSPFPCHATNPDLSRPMQRRKAGRGVDSHGLPAVG